MQQTRVVIDRLFAEGRVVARSDGSVHDLFPVSVTRDEGEALGRWVRRESAVRTIEVGLGFGVSSLFICEGLLANGDAEARHLAFDPNQSEWFSDCGLQVIEDARIADLVEFRPEPSEIALPRLLGEARRFDLGFVDGNHRFDGVFMDLVYLGRLVKGGGIIFVDDHQMPAVAKAVSFCVTNLGWTLEEVSQDGEHHHWAVLRTAVVPTDRPFDYFVEF